jgi:hypothetical protein
MKITTILFLLLFFLKSQGQNSQSIFLFPQNDINDFIKEKIQTGVLEGKIMDCYQKYIWKTISVEALEFKITAIDEPVTEHDILKWIFYQQKNGIKKGKLNFCAHQAIWNKSYIKISPIREEKKREVKKQLNLITDHVNLEKIIELKLPANTDNYGLYACSIFNNDFWIFNYDFIRKGLLLFLKIDMKTYAIDTLKIPIPVPETVFYKQNGAMISLAVDDNYVIIGTEEDLLIFIKDGDQLSFLKMIKTGTDIRHLSVHNNLIYFGFCNNYQVIEDDNFTMIKLYDINKDSIIKQITPEFDLIEFSETVPNNWIDMKEGKVLFSQAANYRLSYFNDSLTIAGAIDPQDSLWIPVPEEIKRKIEEIRGVEPEYSEYYHNTFRPVSFKVNKIPDVRIVDNNTIMVTIKPNYKEKLENPEVGYFYDIWNFDGKNFTRTHFRLRDIVPNENTVCSFTNYPLRADFTGSLDFKFSNDKIAVLKYDVNVNPIGLKYKVIKNKFLPKMIADKPGVNLYIYSYNFK